MKSNGQARSNDFQEHVRFILRDSKEWYRYTVVLWKIRGLWQTLKLMIIGGPIYSIVLSNSLRHCNRTSLLYSTLESSYSFKFIIVNWSFFPRRIDLAPTQWISKSFTPFVSFSRSSRQHQVLDNTLVFWITRSIYPTFVFSWIDLLVIILTVFSPLFRFVGFMESSKKQKTHKTRHGENT
ncbi:hypothetical protein F5Y02DRAFT_132278 [Annulohypoxylon stygium]|nr:hypothetical protein F5Y02DRAFT_132278 [Annulohypoxylon stygium]